MNHYKIFLSHTWKYDEQNRNTHTRVINLKTELEKLEQITWIDDENMIHDLDGSMAYGIDNCTAIIIFITKKYNLKVNQAAKNPSINDNCYKECVYAFNSGKTCIPVIFEDCMLDIDEWENGILKLYFGNKMYIDGSKNNYDIIAENIIRLLNRTSKRILELDNLNIKNNFKNNKKLSPLKIINDKIKQINNKTIPNRIAPVLPIIPMIPISNNLNDKSSQTGNISPIKTLRKRLNKIIDQKNCCIFSKGFLNKYLVK